MLSLGGGDQQLYAIMKNLKRKDLDTFEWLFPVPGDWHFIKTVSEVLKSVMEWRVSRYSSKLWHEEGGLKVEGYTSNSHRITRSPNESNFKHCHDTGLFDISEEFQNWGKFEICVQELSKGKNEVSQSWCNLLHFLMVYFAYYMAIRSGNWVLRNACIKQSCDLLFAYARDKYEVLAVQTLSDVLTYPTAIIQQFEQGHWTASKLGVPFHNQALDELHETEINCGLKQVASRPPYFQVVELSNFLAYLENVVSCFCSDVGKTRKSKIVHDTHLPTIVTDLVEKSLDLKCLDAVELHNVFAHCPKSLDKPTRSDLLDIRNAGRRRLVSYVRQYALCPPTEVPGKCSRQKLRTFTTRTWISREKAKVQKATRLLENAYAHVIRSGVALAQTCPLPLAIAMGKGKIRQRPKSSIRLAFVRDPVLAPIFATTCSLLTANKTAFDFVIDFLRVLHQPPPSQGVSLLEFCQYMWHQIVVKMGFCEGLVGLLLSLTKQNFCLPLGNCFIQ